MSKMWKKILYADKGKHGNNMNSISIPVLWSDMNTTIMLDCELKDHKKAEQWRTVELPEEILHYFTEQNQQHLGQDHSTLFTIPPLSQYFDWLANSPVSKMVLQGEFNTKELDELQQLFLHHCKMEPIY
eukprot:7173402-Ditylum_brightwellii.AAC.1